jgi:hypothetical protein
LPSPTEPIYEYGDYMVGGVRDFGPDRNDNDKADFFFVWGAWHFGTDQMLLWMEPHAATGFSHSDARASAVNGL